MKNILLFALIALASCSKSDDFVANRPIKKDNVAPTVTVQQSSIVPLYGTCDMRIVAQDNMSLRAVYYYENDCLSRTFITQFSPGNTATYWEYTFPFYMYTDKVAIRVVVEDMAGNTAETQLIVNN